MLRSCALEWTGNWDDYICLVLSLKRNAMNPFKRDKAYGQVNGLHNEYGRLLLEERKWANYEQTLSILHAKVEGLESKKEMTQGF
ncbi:hypothetical protein Tco_1100014 [Tanacetum coccineum]